MEEQRFVISNSKKLKKVMSALNLAMDDLSSGEVVTTKKDIVNDLKYKEGREGKKKKNVTYLESTAYLNAAIERELMTRENLRSRR